MPPAVLGRRRSARRVQGARRGTDEQNGAANRVPRRIRQRRTYEWSAGPTPCLPLVGALAPRGAIAPIGQGHAADAPLPNHGFSDSGEGNVRHESGTCSDWFGRRPQVPARFLICGLASRAILLGWGIFVVSSERLRDVGPQDASGGAVGRRSVVRRSGRYDGTPGAKPRRRETHAVDRARLTP